MAEEKPNGGTKTVGKLELADKAAPQNGQKEYEEYHETGLALRDAGEIEVAESFTSAGVRPIAASHMEIFATILNDRPIMASHLKVLDYSLPGGRPIFASDMIIRDDLTLPGGRPIIASDPRLLEASLITGGRPIAPNDIGDGEPLMGYID